MSKLLFFRTLKLFAVVFIASAIYFISSSNSPSNQLINGLETPYPAPQIAGISAWINSPPLLLDKLKNKVVLVDFWTYSCVNCIRTLPFLNSWYGKYHAQGFEIIGVHSPEFEFEDDFANVEHAVKKYGIHYPVALDNQFVTWKNFKNQFWPAHYLINKNGFVVYEHFGEGKYDVTENNIRFLLGMNEPVSAEPIAEKPSFLQTPETYLGYLRAEHYSSPQSIVRGRPMQYSFPNSLSESQWALQGYWIIGPQYIVSAQTQAALKINFRAKKVFIVMGSVNGKKIPLKLLLNDKKLIDEKGRDVTDGAILVGRPRLYEVVDLKEFGSGTLELISEAPGVAVYTFTFGS